MALVFPERSPSPEGFPGMEALNQYRKFAEECRRLARRVESEEHRKILEQMAEVWSRLAAEAAQKSSQTGSRQSDESA
jgi:hypothetical protein